MRKILPLLLSLQSCLGAGDIFAKREQIAGNYYLTEKEDGGYAICYKIDGSYIGRSPSDSHLIAYAVMDSILIVKSQDYQYNTVYHVLNMNRDNGYSRDENIYLDTIPEDLFKGSWIDDAKYRFIQVK